MRKTDDELMREWMLLQQSRRECVADIRAATEALQWANKAASELSVELAQRGYTVIAKPF